MNTSENVETATINITMSFSSTVQESQLPNSTIIDQRTLNSTTDLTPRTTAKLGTTDATPTTNPSESTPLPASTLDTTLPAVRTSSTSKPPGSIPEPYVPEMTTSSHVVPTDPPRVQIYTEKEDIAGQTVASAGEYKLLVSQYSFTFFYGHLSLYIITF